jgi:phage-related protein
MSDKPIAWIGSSQSDLRRFPREARRKAGFELRAVQRGQDPSDFKPIPVVGPGTYEIRIQTDGAYRVFYVAKFEEAIYVLHAFPKKTQKTSKHDLAIGQQGYHTVQQARRQARQGGQEAANRPRQ